MTCTHQPPYLYPPYACPPFLGGLGARVVVDAFPRGVQFKYQELMKRHDPSQSITKTCFTQSSSKKRCLILSVVSSRSGASDCEKTHCFTVLAASSRPIPHDRALSRRCRAISSPMLPANLKPSLRGNRRSPHTCTALRLVQPTLAGLARAPAPAGYAGGAGVDDCAAYHPRS